MTDKNLDLRDAVTAETDLSDVDAMEAATTPAGLENAPAEGAAFSAATKVPQQEDLLAGLNQFRATRLQILNWGTFSGYHDVPIARKGFLFVGSSGSGKSTLLDAMVTLLFPAPDYNAAAREGDKRRGDRSLMSYIRGAFGTQTESDERGTRTTTQYSRTGSTFSAIALTLEDLMGESVTLMMVAYVKGETTEESKVNRMYYVLRSPWSFNLKTFREFAQFASFDFKWLRRSLPEPEVYQTFSAYGERFRELFRIRDKSAMKLLAKAQSAKNLGDLNTFLRDFMLEEPKTFETAANLAREFDELDEAHRAVVRAREQEECLAAARDAIRTRAEQEARWQAVTSQRDALPYWRLTRSAEFHEEDVREASQKEEDARRKMEHAEREQILATEDVNTLLKRSYEKGGAALERIKDQVAQAEETLRVVDERRRKVAIQAATIRPEFPTDEDGWAVLSQEARRLTDERDATAKARLAKRDALTAELTCAENEFRVRRREIEAMRARPSNIPSEYLDVRRDIAATIDVPEDRLPFVGEWLEIRQEDAQWQGAIERVLRSFSLSVMVPEDCADAFIEAVETKHLGLRLVYHRVKTKKARKAAKSAAKKPENAFSALQSLRSAPADERPMLPQKLVLKDGDFTSWLEEELAARFDYYCAPDLDAFREAERAVTIHGQVRHNARRFEKDDRSRVDDRKNWVTGFSNTAKLALYESEAQQFATDIGRISRERTALDAEMAQESLLQTAAQWIVSTRWAEIDVVGAQKTLDQLKAEFVRMTDGNLELRAIEVQLQEAQARLQQSRERFTLASNIHSLARRDRETAEAELKIDRARLAAKADEAPVPDQALLDLLETRVTMGGRTSVTRANLPDLTEAARRRMEDEKDAAMIAMRNAENQVSNRFAEFKRRWPTAEVQELDDTITSAPAFMKMLERLERDGLPKYESRFRELLDNQSLQNFTALQMQLKEGRRTIFERIAVVNKSLESAPFSRTEDGETHLRIDVKDRKHPDVAELQEKLNGILRTAWREATDQEIEERFRAVKDLVARLNPENAQDERWRKTVLDVREHVEFLAVELDDEGRVVETYLSGAGKSGGQRQKLTTTCLAAALRYQLGESAEGLPAFAPVILDEAFDKADSEFTDLSMSIFRRFGFQMIVATPEKAVGTLETFIGGAALITIKERQFSGVLAVEYDSEASQLNWEVIGPSGLSEAQLTAIQENEAKIAAKKKAAKDAKAQGPLPQTGSLFEDAAKAAQSQDGEAAKAESAVTSETADSTESTEP